MAPTEDGIVRSFLLQKAALRDVLTMTEFASFFPPSKRNSPLVRALYRDLQSQRNAVCEGVLKQLHLECRFGDNLIAQARARRQNPQGDEEGASMEKILDSQVRLYQIFEKRLSVALWWSRSRVRRRGTSYYGRNGQCY
jgi:hypothetical protein